MDEILITSSKHPDELVTFLGHLERLSAKSRRDLMHRHSNNSLDEVLIEAALELSTSSNVGKLFRKTGESDEALRAVWFAECLQLAKNSSVRRHLSPFKGLDFEDLRELAKHSVSEESPTTIQNTLASQYGIVLVYNKAYPGMKLDGVATRLFGRVPVIALSLRYARYNYFWFTLMHELSHIALHFDKLDNAIFDDLDESSTVEIEVEANRYAADAITPRPLFLRSQALRSLDAKDVLTLAEKAEVHPSLVAGALQHHKNNYQIYKDIVNKINVRTMLGMEDGN